MQIQCARILSPLVEGISVGLVQHVLGLKLHVGEHHGDVLLPFALKDLILGRLFHMVHVGLLAQKTHRGALLGLGRARH